MTENSVSPQDTLLDLDRGKWEILFSWTDANLIDLTCKCHNRKVGSVAIGAHILGNCYCHICIWNHPSPPCYLRFLWKSQAVDIWRTLS